MELPVSFGRLHILPILNQFMNEWRSFRSACPSTTAVDLIDEGADLAIRLGGSGDA
jgi:DNA-binding transcriptional LysR family regulator